jgi:hypothetical protein
MSEQRARPPAPPNTWPSADDLKAAAYAWAERISITLLRVSVRKMRRKWASISTAGRLTLSTDLLQIPSSRPKSREGVQEFYAGLSAGLGRERAAAATISMTA